jgi:DNA-directed RNA polymerase subunit RPC12/RpoP
MAFIDTTCPNCGGKIKLDETQEKGICPYCKSEVYLKADESLANQGLRALDLLKESKPIAASDLANEGLKGNPYYGLFYLVLLIYDLGLKEPDELSHAGKDFSTDVNYIKALTYLPKEDAEGLRNACEENKKSLAGVSKQSSDETAGALPFIQEKQAVAATVTATVNETEKVRKVRALLLYKDKYQCSQSMINILMPSGNDIDAQSLYYDDIAGVYAMDNFQQAFALYKTFQKEDFDLLGTQERRFFRFFVRNEPNIQLYLKNKAIKDQNHKYVDEKYAIPFCKLFKEERELQHKLATNDFEYIGLKYDAQERLAKVQAEESEIEDQMSKLGYEMDDFPDAEEIYKEPDSE